VLVKLSERKQQSTQVAGGFGFVAAILSCKGPCWLFLSVAPFMHNGHDSALVYIHGCIEWDMVMFYCSLLPFFCMNMAS
jgi:hypothetical protein